MQKVAFNQEGLNQKTESLKSQSREELQKELCELQFQTKAWLQNNFEFNNDQVEYIDSIPQEMLDHIGAATAYAIFEKQPVKLVVPERYENPNTSKRPVKVEVEVQAAGDMGFRRKSAY